MNARADDSRWGEVRLIVHRAAGGSAAWAIVVRTGSGRSLLDRRAGHGVIPCPPGSRASQDPLEALLAVLEITHPALRA